MRAVAQLGASFTMQSQLSEKWTTVNLGSALGFHNSEEASKGHKDFWLEIAFKKPSQVQQIIIQKRGDWESCGCDDGKKKCIINKVRIDYLDGNVWKNYKEGVLLDTAQDQNDTANFERKIYVDE